MILGGSLRAGSPAFCLLFGKNMTWEGPFPHTHPMSQLPRLRLSAALCNQAAPHPLSHLEKDTANTYLSK